MNDNEKNRYDESIINEKGNDLFLDIPEKESEPQSEESAGQSDIIEGLFIAPKEESQPDSYFRDEPEIFLPDMEKAPPTIEFKKPHPFVREIFDWVELFVIALVCVVLTFTFLFRFVVVEGQSMMNTLYDGNGLIISNLFYTPSDGDIVVVKVAGHDNPLIKRVIAIEGETVDIDFENWVVTVTGLDGITRTLSEPYVLRTLKTMINKTGQEYPLTVSEDHIFVMGDNRNNSDDSRSASIGEIDVHYILGRVMFRIYPFDRIGTEGLYIGSDKPNA